MTEDSCGKCGAVLKIEIEYITFKEGNVAYRKCPGCNTTSKIAFEKVKHLLNSIRPLIESSENDNNKDSIRPLIEIDTKGSLIKPNEPKKTDSIDFEEKKYSDDSIRPVIEIKNVKKEHSIQPVIEMQEMIMNFIQPLIESNMKTSQAEFKDIYQIIEAFGVELDELKNKSVSHTVYPEITKRLEILEKRLNSDKDFTIGVNDNLFAIRKDLDDLKAKPAQPIVIPEINQLRSEIELLKSDTQKVLARDAEEMEALRKQIDLLENKNKPIASEVVKLEEYRELEQDKVIKPRRKSCTDGGKTDEELVAERIEYMREVQKRRAVEESMKPESKRKIIDLHLYDNGEIFL